MPNLQKASFFSSFDDLLTAESTMGETIAANEPRDYIVAGGKPPK